MVAILNTRLKTYRRIIRFMRILVCFAAILLLAVWGCVDSEPETAKDNTKTKPLAGTSNVDFPVLENKVVLAMNPDGPPVEVRPFNDPANPYRVDYSELDHWIWDNYDPGEENPALWPLPIPEKLTQRSLVVDADGFAIPGLQLTKIELDRRMQGLPANHKPGKCTLYSLGNLPDEVHFRNLEQRYRLIARYMPPIPQWLADTPSNWALQLTDETLVTLGEPGSGEGYFPDSDSLRSLLDSSAQHYTINGELLASGQAGNLWFELFFEGFDELLAGFGIDRTSVTTTGWFVVVHVPGEARSVKVFFYDGTPVTEDELQVSPDLNYLFEMYGKFIPAMYEEQQLNGAGNTDG